MDLRWPSYRFEVPKDLAAQDTVSNIFWGIYESAEIRQIESHMNPNLDVIELGCSLGIVSSHIAAKLAAGRRLVSVEANPNLIPFAKRNIERNRNPGVSIEVINSAISFEPRSIYFECNPDHTCSRVVNSPGEYTVEVPSLRLSGLLQSYSITSFTLCCDIEGAELGIFLDDHEAFDSCCDIFIELHSTEYRGEFYSAKQIEEIVVTKLNFKVRHKYGNVYWFSR